MTVDELCQHIRESFRKENFRVVAFGVRAYTPGGTVTIRRGKIRGTRTSKVEMEAVRLALVKPEAPARVVITPDRDS